MAKTYNMVEEEYVLGTDREELWRLGLQHQVWSSEARQAWHGAGFSPGHSLLDLGCGPGFCTMDMAYLVGHAGRVIAIDKSRPYIDFLEAQKKMHALPIETKISSFETLELAADSLDGAYCRWALAWLDNPAAVIDKVHHGLKSGAKFAIHEYYHWRTFQFAPHMDGVMTGVSAAFDSFATSGGDINVGKIIPELINTSKWKVVSVRSMTKLGHRGDLVWQWPVSFLRIYLPKVQAMGLLTKAELEAALVDLEALEKIPHATVSCPLMCEWIIECVK